MICMSWSSLSCSCLSYSALLCLSTSLVRASSAAIFFSCSLRLLSLARSSASLSARRFSSAAFFFSCSLRLLSLACSSASFSARHFSSASLRFFSRSSLSPRRRASSFSAASLRLNSLSLSRSRRIAASSFSRRHLLQIPFSFQVFIVQRSFVLGFSRSQLTLVLSK